MQKNAYHFLFGEETLYRADEPEPLILPSPKEIFRKPEPVAEPASTPSVLTELPEEMPAPELLTTVGPEIVRPLLPLVESPVPTMPSLTQRVLVLVDEELTPSEQIFLEKIVKSVGLSLEEIDLLNLAGSGVLDLRPLLEGKVLHHFISFGVPFTSIQLDIHMDRYNPVRISGITFLLADPLSALEADRQLKRKLWTVLQKVFLNP